MFGTLLAAFSALLAIQHFLSAKGSQIFLVASGQFRGTGSNQAFIQFIIIGETGDGSRDMFVVP